MPAQTLVQSANVEPIAFNYMNPAGGFDFFDKVLLDLFESLHNLCFQYNVFRCCLFS